MTKLLQEAIRAVRELPEDRQEKVARAILNYAAHDDHVNHLSDDERAAVRVGLQQAKRGEFVSDVELERFRNRHRA